MIKNIETIDSSVTIEDLAGMIKRGFDSVDSRFDDVYRRFGEIDRKFDTLTSEMRNGFKRLNDKFDKAEERHDLLSNVVHKDHSVRIRRLEKKCLAV